MRFHSAVPLLFSCVFLPISAPAQQTPPQRDPRAVAILQQSLTAIGGAAAAGRVVINDVTLTGRARRIAGSDDETGTAVVKALATGEARMDFSFPSGQHSEVRTNSEKGPAGKWSGRDGTAHTISRHNLMVDSSWFFPALMLRRLSSSQGFAVSYAGNETWDGRAVEHLTVSQQFPGVPARAAALMQRLSQMEIYLDASTLLPSAVSFNTHPDNDAGRDIPVEIRYSDYRVVNGAQVPFHVQKYLNNGLVLDVQFETAALNTGLSASSFSTP